MITLIDNYDSFTYNLYHYLSSKERVVIIKNDQISKNFKNIIEYYSHVMHIVSNVTGVLKNGFSPIDVLYAEIGRAHV